jgi:iron complex outermembrane recepter protein
VSGCARWRRTAKEQPGATFGQAGLGPRGSVGQDNQAYSFLGTVDWHAADRLTAPLGVNSTNDEKSVSSQGLEVDATWNATENLVLTFAGTFQDPVYESFTASATGDISATTPSGIPETATPTSATYSFDVKNLAAFVRADWQYESPVAYFDAFGAGFAGTDNNALLGYEKEISTINASAGFTTENGLGVTFWGRNIFDDQYITTAFPGVAQAGSLSGYPSAPPTYGVTVRKSF